jgi:hypothetical protein
MPSPDPTPSKPTSNGTSSNSNGSFNPKQPLNLLHSLPTQDRSLSFLEELDINFNPPQTIDKGKSVWEGSDIKRVELVRVLMQALEDAGYTYVIHSILLYHILIKTLVHIYILYFDLNRETVRMLGIESGIEYESQVVKKFRYGVMTGDWEEVVRLVEDGEIQLLHNDPNVCTFLTLLIRLLRNLSPSLLS